jgi:hypothetical protein
VDVRARLRRYAALRAAVRAISPAFPPDTSLELQERVQELSGRLRSAASAGGPSPDAGQASLRLELDRIEEEWDGFARDLIARISELPLSQIRATLPGVRESNPDELLALLDLWIADEETLADRWTLLDYMVTLAATETHSGRKRITGDPTALTAAFQALCTRTGEAAERTDDLVRGFQGAWQKVRKGEALGPIRKELRDLKASAVSQLLAPDVLRAIVSCNVALWNRLEELTEVDRTLADAERRGLGAAKAAEAEPPPAVRASGASVFDCEPIHALEAALQRRLRGEAGGSDAASQLLDRLDVSGLSRFEEMAFTSWADGNGPRAVRAAAVVGLLIRDPRAMAAQLAKLGIGTGKLRETWIPELAAELLGATEECLASRMRADEALRLAEVRTRFLRTASEQSLWSEEPEPARPAETPAKPRPRERPAPTPRRAPKAEARTSRSAARSLALAVGVALVIASVGLHFWVKGGETIATYSAAEVRGISPYLESAYRSSYGYGPLVIGTLGDDWAGLSHEERVTLGTEIGERLGLDGVDEVMLFDGRKRLEIHYTGSKLRHVAPPN